MNFLFKNEEFCIQNDEFCKIWFCVSAGFYGQSINLPAFLRQKNLSEEEGYLSVLVAVCG